MNHSIKERAPMFRTTATQRAELVYMPQGETGPCIVCRKPELSHGSWCYGCGSFVCTTHDTEAALPCGAAHLPSDHGETFVVDRRPLS